jgi:glycosyltransferase involved in cell wall biosynthesis
MILLINTSNLSKGGGIQAALSFIQELINIPENEYHIFLGKNIISQVNSIEFPENFHLYYIRNSPSSLVHGIGIINELRKLENIIKPDCVFTVFGPSYWTPKSPHLLGFAQGYYLYPESKFFGSIRLSNKFKINSLKVIHRFFFIKNANYYYIESENAKERLSSFLCKRRENIYVITNTYHSVFNLNLDGNHILPEKKNDEIRLITISSYYHHKNLEIIKDVIAKLKEKSILKFIFILTISPVIFEQKFKNFDANIINLGPVSIDLCPKLYQECDFLFLPTLIEIFSASYPEAMKMKKPILTSDLSFAHEVCSEAAEYFDPLNPEDIANKIIYLANNTKRQIELIDKGERRLFDFETPKSRAEKLLAICCDLIKMRSMNEYS